MTEAIELGTSFDLETIRQAADGPATGPLGLRLQAIIAQMLPVYAASLEPAAEAAAEYEPTREEINAFRDAHETAKRYGYGADDNRLIAEGLKAARKVRP